MPPTGKQWSIVSAYLSSLGL